jgi:hypothetical protein
MRRHSVPFDVSARTRGGKGPIARVLRKSYTTCAVVALSLFLLATALVAGPTEATNAATSTTGTNWDPGGQPMPTGNLPGWHQVFADNFADQSYPVGSFTGCTLFEDKPCAGTPSVPLAANPDGWSDPSTHCEFFPSKTASVAGGILNIFLHTQGGKCLGANFQPVLSPMLYGRYSIRFRADAVPGYKMVASFWPTNNTNGEIDFPEGDLTSAMHGALHRIAGGKPWWDFYSTATFSSWHTATVEWTPTAVTYILDGTILGTRTSPGYPIPQTPMYMTFRGASILGSPTKPPTGASGNVQIDWVTVYSYDPPPAISSVAQTVGRNDPGSYVLINGPGFVPKASVSFSDPDILVTGSPSLVTPNQLAVPVTVGASASLVSSNVTVTEPNGSATCVSCIAVDAGPGVQGASPGVATSSTDITVAITGSNLRAPLTLSTTAPGVRLGSPITVTGTSIKLPVTVPWNTPSGGYDLMVQNADGGSATCAACLNVLTVPGAPALISATLTAPHQVTVSFNPPTDTGNTPITRYTLTANDTTQAARGGQTASGLTGPLTVGGLTIGDRYTFHVSATNAVGTSWPSVPSPPLTPDSPKAPNSSD